MSTSARAQFLATAPEGYVPEIAGYNLKAGEAWLAPLLASEKDLRVVKPAISVTTEASVDDLTVPEALEALEDHVQAAFCYGAAPLRDILILSTHSSTAFKIKLDSFVERRKFQYLARPCAEVAAGGTVPPPPDYSRVPQPWDVPVELPTLFEDATSAPIDVPGTLTIKECFHCDGGGRLRCQHCEGAGANRCASCSGEKKKVCAPCKGKGYLYRSNAPNVADDCGACRGLGFQQCRPCSGRGETKCNPCAGRGDFSCELCKGRGMLEICICMTVQWKTESLEKTSGEKLAPGAVPPALIKLEQGEVIAEAPRAQLVAPFTSPNLPKSVGAASEDVVRLSHNCSGRIIIQSHYASRVPIWEVRAKFTKDNRPFTYFVYGKQHAVHEEEYPASTCCGLLYACGLYF